MPNAIDGGVDSMPIVSPLQIGTHLVPIEQSRPRRQLTRTRRLRSKTAPQPYICLAVGSPMAEHPLRPSGYEHSTDWLKC